MANVSTDTLDLVNDTVVNVAGLLQDLVGSKRDYGLRLDAFALADDLQAARLEGAVRLTRLSDEILAAVRLKGQVHLECVRCLRIYVEDFRAQFEEEYRQTVNVRTGAGIKPDRDPDEVEDMFEIDELHQIDLAEALRQHVILSLPMRPDCGIECPGPAPVVGDEGRTAEVDERLAALAALLDRDASRD